MGLFEYLIRNNKVGVMMDEKEVYDKVCCIIVLKKVVEKKGLIFILEGVLKIQLCRLFDESKGIEKWKSKFKNVFFKNFNWMDILQIWKFI